MDAFLRRVIEQRQREDAERYRTGRLVDLPGPEDDQEQPEQPEGGWRSFGRVLDLFESRAELTADDLINELGMTRTAASVALSRMVRSGCLERVRAGVYRRARREDA